MGGPAPEDPLAGVGVVDGGISAEVLDASAPAESDVDDVSLAPMALAAASPAEVGVSPACIGAVDGGSAPEGHVTVQPAEAGVVDEGPAPVVLVAGLPAGIEVGDGGDSLEVPPAVPPDLWLQLEGLEYSEEVFENLFRDYWVSAGFEVLRLEYLSKDNRRALFPRLVAHLQNELRKSETRSCSANCTSPWTS